MGNEECRNQRADNPQSPSQEPVVSRMKANIKDRQPDGQEEAVEHPHQDQNLNDNGYRSQCYSSVSDVRIFLNPNPAQAGSVPTPFKNPPESGRRACSGRNGLAGPGRQDLQIPQTQDKQESHE
jgi:hypothetical protein